MDARTFYKTLSGIILTFVLWGNQCLAASDASEEKRLTKQLLDTYESSGRFGVPSINNATVEVDIRFGLNKIFTVDAEKQEMVTIGWLYTKWVDPLLKWDPALYDGISSIVVPLNQIWSPDIVLLNAVEPSVSMYSDLSVLVKSTGEVLHVPKYKFTSMCEMEEGTEDNPECPLIFGSWAHPKDKLRLGNAANHGDAANHVQNTRYVLVSLNSKEEVRSYICCPGTSYSDISYTIQLQARKSSKTDDKEESSATRETSTLVITLAAALALLAAKS